ncbi:MAG TPA: choice-of-anchor tandem repeat GloVer-containing protein [Terriglobales bacterium]|nr:choice-of-anchor tandem repeat GloVer-containing protein [Terriglobales bacterium]
MKLNRTGQLRIHLRGDELAKLLAVITLLVLVVSVAAQAQTEDVLYSFAGAPDGATPNSGLIRDARGNLYGTSFGGGNLGYGTVFKLSADGQETVLHSFGAQGDGVFPGSGLTRVGTTFYGTTVQGGANYFGSVFSVTKTGNEAMVASLSFEEGGGYPEGALLRDKQGNLYGTNSGYNGGYGNGAIFEISPSGTVTVPYRFTGGADGLCPYGNLVKDAKGNLYGTTYRGGTAGRGNVYKLSPDGTLTVLYSFTGGADGDLPAAGLVRDSKGNLYGTTVEGGGQGYGAVFMVTAKGKESVLHSFSGSDGFYPIGGLVRDTSGNIYGTTELGGSYGQGNVFKISPGGVFTKLYDFHGSNDGGWPTGNLILDKQGNLYGTTSYGGSSNCLDGCGVVFRIKP